MPSRLNSAEPTIVLGPSEPAYISFWKSSITESRISGADEPSAISVRLATVSFHTRVRRRARHGSRAKRARARARERVRARARTFTRNSWPSKMMVFFWLVIVSIAAMNTSATMATAANSQNRNSR